MPVTKNIRVLRKQDWFHRDAFPVAVHRREPQEPFGPHTHEFAELVIITGGRGVHVVGNERWPLTAGDVFVIGGPRPHDYQDLRDLKLINILFDLPRMGIDPKDLATLPGYHALFTLEPAWRRRHRFQSRLHLDRRDLGIATTHVDELDRELRERRPGFGFAATVAFMQIVCFLSRCYGKLENPGSQALLRIGEAIAHLETHFDEPITVDDLAEMAGMSRRSFIRAFQAATGEAPIAYLIQLRINRASHLLARTRDPVTEIALRSGFSDSNYFTRQFRRRMGMSPREFRQRSG